MDFPTENFMFVKLKKEYKQREKIQETGIYWHPIDKTFDLVHVSRNHLGEIRDRTIVTRVPEHATFADPEGMYASAMEQLTAFGRRVAVKKPQSERVAAV